MRTIFAILIMMYAAISMQAQTVYTVTKTTDPDPWLYFSNPDDPEIQGTLQWAIRKANDAAEPCTILFNISGTGHQVINLNNELPILTNQVIIDGTSQPGYVENQPLIVIDGQNTLYTAFQINNQSNCKITGLYIRNFTYHAIVFYQTTNSEISWNILNNIRSTGANATAGIRLMSSNYNTIKSNFMGTDPILSQDLGIGNYGIYNELGSSNNVIGGTGLNEGNTIAYNGTRGIWIASGTGNRISGNRIFNNPTGVLIQIGANNDKQPPVITAYNPDGTITGTSEPGDIIEIFGSTGNENANEFLTSVTAGAEGSWTATVSSNDWNYGVATATDADENTSKLCNAFEKTDPCIGNPVYADAGQNANITTGGSAQIGSDPVAGYAYSWTPVTGLSNPSIANPIANPTTTTIYTLVVTNESGCSSTDFVRVSVTIGEPSQVTPDGIFDNIYDLYGNKYRLNDLSIANAVNGTNSAGTKSWILCDQSGYFNLYFEEGSGMLDGESPDASDRRTVICQLFKDISDFINSPLTNTENKVNIWIRDISNLPINPYGIAGVASPFFCIPSGAPSINGIADNEVWKTINSGFDSYTNCASPLVTQGGQSTSSGTFFHGTIAFNFSNATEWHCLLGANPDDTKKDLYSVALHELIHLLGFGSLIDKYGQSKFGSDCNYYSRFDRFLYAPATPDNIPLLIQNGSCSMYNYQFNPLLNSSVLRPYPFNCNTQILYEGSITQDVYTPIIFNSGSSLSHFVDICHGNGEPYFVMNPGYYPIGDEYEKRHIQPEERSVLCDMGYSVNPTYGCTANHTWMDYESATCPGIQVVGINDGINSDGTYAFVTTVNYPTDPIYPLSNDYPNTGTTFDCLEIVIGSGDISNYGNQYFDYSPHTPGTHLLRYVPVYNGIRGNITYIIIRANSNYCEASPCNMITNGEFENSYSDCGEFHQAFVYCWDEFSQTADLYSRTCGDYTFGIPYNWMSNVPVSTWDDNSENNNYMGLCASHYSTDNTIYEESIQNSLSNPIVNGNYILRFYARVAYKSTVINVPANIAVTASQQTLLYAGDYYDIYNPNLQILVPSITIPANGMWNPIEVPFQYAGNVALNNLIIGYDVIQDFGNGKAYVYLDDVQLLPAESAPSFTPPASLCPNQTIADLSAYVNPPGGTFSGDGVNPADNSFSASAAGLGIHNITYNYTNNIGCENSVTAQIEVKNPDFDVFVSTVDTYCDNPCNGSAIANVFGTSAYTYVWSNGSIDQEITGLCSGNYSVTVSDPDGCTVQNPAVIESLPPTVSFSVATSCISRGSLVSFQNNTQPAGLAYYWDFGDGSSSVDANPVHTFHTIGYFCIKLTADGGTGCYGEYSQVIYVNPSSCICNQSYNIPDGKTYDNEVVSWANGTKVEGDVFLTDGTQLTIPANATIYFAPKGRILIKGSSDMIIENGAKLTSLGGLCNYMWQGIEVWGNGCMPSSWSGQSSLTITGATVENAHIAVLAGARNFDNLCNPASILFMTTASGGRLVADGAVFNKNGIDIKYIPGQSADANSNSITNCTFTGGVLIDGNYKSSASNHYPNAGNPWCGTANTTGRTVNGIWMQRRNNIAFDNNTFSDIEIAMESYDSKYTVTGSHFNKHRYGMYIGNTSYNANLSHEISGCDFDNTPGVSTERGAAIYVAGGVNDHIYGNLLGTPTSTQNLNYNGVVMMSSSGFHITENIFNNYMTGVYVSNSSTGGGWVGNEFTTEGNKFYGCRQSILTNGNNKSLTLRCNSSQNDILNTVYYKNYMNYGKLAVQGDPLTSPSGVLAGNQFKPEDKKHIKAADYPYDYYYHNLYSSLHPEVIPTPENVNAYPINVEFLQNRACPVQNFSKNGLLAKSDSIAARLAELENVLGLLVTDGGNTAQVLNSVQGNMPDGKLKNMLLAASPLSDEVVNALLAVNRSLSNGNFKQVMEKNLPVSEDNQSLLFDKFDLLPPGIAGQLRPLQGYNPQVMNTAGLNREISNTRMLQMQVTAMLLNALLAEGNTAQAEQLLESVAMPYGDMLLASAWLTDETKIGNAESKINGLDGTDLQLAEWKQLGEILVYLAQNGNDYSLLTGQQTGTLQALAAECLFTPASAHAFNILRLMYGTDIPECDPESNTFKSLTQNTNSVASEPVFELFPNPAKDYIELKYTLPENADNAVLLIYDATGRKLKYYYLPLKGTEVTLSVSCLPAGLYTCYLMSGDAILGIKKLTLTE